MNSDKFKRFVLESWYDGMDAQDIANSPTSKRLYAENSKGKLTKKSDWKKAYISLKAEDRIEISQD